MKNEEFGKASAKPKLTEKGGIEAYRERVG
jgi:hypothetical protein